MKCRSQCYCDSIYLCLSLDVSGWACNLEREIILDFFSLLYRKISISLPCIPSEIESHKNIRLMVNEVNGNLQ